MTYNISPSQLTTQVRVLAKTKYFPLEIQGVGLKPITIYDAYFDGIKVNAFCKPYGKNLGDPMISDDAGKLKIQFHMAIQYNQKYLTAPANASDSSNIFNHHKTFQLTDPSSGKSSLYYIPILLKA